MQRSGTTLLARLLDLHPRLSILSQPFPLLFVETKRAFLRGRGRTDLRYPLGHLFLDADYRPDELCRYLGELQIDPAQLARLFEEMHAFSGQYTRFERSLLQRVLPQLDCTGFSVLLAELCRALAPEPYSETIGSKETTCEEFLPHLLGGGWRCMLIVRDPRDVVASLNHGRGAEYAGRLKPTLFNVRQWRKSVAFALYLEGYPAFLWLRYEDLVDDPHATLSRIAATFDLAPFTRDIAAGEIRDGSGRLWNGNSSHGDRRAVDRASVGAYRAALAPAVARFIEAACLPELRLLGYPTDMSRGEASAVLSDLDDPYEITREGLESDAAGAANAGRELRRLELLAAAPSTTALPYVLFERAHERLHAAARA